MESRLNSYEKMLVRKSLVAYRDASVKQRAALMRALTENMKGWTDSETVRLYGNENIVSKFKASRVFLFIINRLKP